MFQQQGNTETALFNQPCTSSINDPLGSAVDHCGHGPLLLFCTSSWSTPTLSRVMLCPFKSSSLTFIFDLARPAICGSLDSQR